MFVLRPRPHRHAVSIFLHHHPTQCVYIHPSPLITLPSHLDQRLIIHPHPDPLLHSLRPNTLIELDARFIPLQHTPLQSLTSNPLRLLCQLSQQQSSISLPPILRPHEKILEIYPWGRAPGAVIREIERHSCTCLIFGGGLSGVTAGSVDEEGFGIALGGS